MTKAEKIQEKVFKQALNEREKMAKQRIREAELEETVLFHAKRIEKILQKEMPKGWHLELTWDLKDAKDETFTKVITQSKNSGQIPIGAAHILAELLDKNNINYHIQNTTSND